MDALFYVVETSGYPITGGASTGSRTQPEHEVSVSGPNGEVYWRQVCRRASGLTHAKYAKHLASARATAENVCWRLNRDEQT